MMSKSEKGILTQVPGACDQESLAYPPSPAEIPAYRASVDQTRAAVWADQAAGRHPSRRQQPLRPRGHAAAMSGDEAVGDREVAVAAGE